MANGCSPPAGRSAIRLVKADECPPSVCPPRRIEYCQTADEFYSTMGCLTQEMLEENLFDSAELMQVRSPRANAEARRFERQKNLKSQLTSISVCT